MRDYLYSRMHGATDHKQADTLTSVLLEVAAELKAVRLALEKRA
jgi:hypothetical protein